MGLPSSETYLIDGWGSAEESFRWSIGRTSRLNLPIPQRGHEHVVVFDVKPWLSPPRVTRQVVTFGINGRYAETLAVTHRVAIGLRISPEQTMAGEVLISLDSHDALTNTAIDTYRNGESMNLMVFTVRLFAGTSRPAQIKGDLPPVHVPHERRANLLAQFESLGHRCAFGLLQQRWHVDQLGLLRFAGIHTPILIRELVQRFVGLGSEPDLHAFVTENSKGFYGLYDRVREIWFNTSQTARDVSPRQVTGLAARRLTFLRRKFLEDLGSGRRIFVLNSPEFMHESEALALFTALNLYGRNSLLWTNQAGSPVPGCVSRNASGLYFGQLDHAGRIEGDPSDEAWFSVCENTRSLLASETE